MGSQHRNRRTLSTPVLRSLGALLPMLAIALVCGSGVRASWAAATAIAVSSRAAGWQPAAASSRTPESRAAGNGAVPGAAPARSGRQPIDVNSASAAELERVRGIGPALAARIVGVRAAGGRFRDTDELRRRVRGIGEANLRRMIAAGLAVGGTERIGPARAAARAGVDLLVGNSPAKSEPRGLGRIEELGCCAVAGAGPLATAAADAQADQRPKPLPRGRARH